MLNRGQEQMTGGTKAVGGFAGCPRAVWAQVRSYLSVCQMLTGLAAAGKQQLLQEQAIASSSCYASLQLYAAECCSAKIIVSPGGLSRAHCQQAVRQTTQLQVMIGLADVPADVSVTPAAGKALLIPLRCRSLVCCRRYHDNQ